MSVTLSREKYLPIQNYYNLFSPKMQDPERTAVSFSEKTEISGTLYERNFIRPIAIFRKLLYNIYISICFSALQIYREPFHRKDDYI